MLNDVGVHRVGQNGLGGEIHHGSANGQKTRDMGAIADACNDGATTMPNSSIVNTKADKAAICGPLYGGVNPFNLCGNGIVL
jgi:hypothetical protein